MPTENQTSQQVIYQQYQKYDVQPDLGDPNAYEELTDEQMREIVKMQEMILSQGLTVDTNNSYNGQVVPRPPQL